MLSVNSVNMLSQRPSFRGAEASYQEYGDYKYYSKDAYESDKTKLEQQLDEMNDLIENATVPKPVRVVAKVFSIGLGVALGFYSMKFGTQGVVKLVHKSSDAVKKFLNKPSCQKIITGTKELFADAKDKIVKKGKDISNYLKDTTIGKRIAKGIESFKGTTFAKKAEKVMNNVKDSQVVSKAKDYAGRARTKVKSITGEQVEKGLIDVFAVSGGVTGGITGLQEATKENE